MKERFHAKIWIGIGLAIPWIVPLLLSTLWGRPGVGGAVFISLGITFVGLLVLSSRAHPHDLAQIFWIPAFVLWATASAIVAIGIASLFPGVMFEALALIVLGPMALLLLGAIIPLYVARPRSWSSRYAVTTFVNLTIIGFTCLQLRILTYRDVSECEVRDSDGRPVADVEVASRVDGSVRLGDLGYSRRTTRTSSTGITFLPWSRHGSDTIIEFSKPGFRRKA